MLKSLNVTVNLFLLSVLSVLLHVFYSSVVWYIHIFNCYVFLVDLNFQHYVIIYTEVCSKSAATMVNCSHFYFLFSLRYTHTLFFTFFPILVYLRIFSIAPCVI